MKHFQIPIQISFSDVLTVEAETLSDAIAKAQQYADGYAKNMYNDISEKHKVTLKGKIDSDGSTVEAICKKLKKQGYGISEEDKLEEMTKSLSASSKTPKVKSKGDATSDNTTNVAAKEENIEQDLFS